MNEQQEYKSFIIFTHCMIKLGVKGQKLATKSQLEESATEILIPREFNGQCQNIFAVRVH